MQDNMLGMRKKQFTLFIILIILQGCDKVDKIHFPHERNLDIEIPLKLKEYNNNQFEYSSDLVIKEIVFSQGTIDPEWIIECTYDTYNRLQRSINTHRDQNKNAWSNYNNIRKWSYSKNKIVEECRNTESLELSFKNVLSFNNNGECIQFEEIYLIEGKYRYNNIFKFYWTNGNMTSMERYGDLGLFSTTYLEYDTNLNPLISLTNHFNPLSFFVGSLSKNNVIKAHTVGYNENFEETTRTYKYDLLDNGLPLKKYKLVDNVWVVDTVYKYYN